MRTLRPCTKLDYLFLFGDNRSAYSDLAVSQSLEDGCAYLLTEGASPLGYLCAVREHGVARVSYGYTVPDARNSGVFTALLSELVKQESFPIRLSVSERNAHHAAVAHVCEKLSFKQGMGSVTFQCNMSAQEFSRWDNYMARTGSKLYALMLKQGFSCVSFAEAGKDVREQLYQSKTSEFKNKLDVRLFFDSKNRRLDENVSFVALKDGEVAAYTLISRPDSASVVFEHISAAERYVGSGAILLPFMRSMEMLQAQSAAGLCSRLAYVMYEDNKNANAFRTHLLAMLTCEQKKTFNFIYRKEA